jgi:uncharacterized membrane protein
MVEVLYTLFHSLWMLGVLLVVLGVARAYQQAEQAGGMRQSMARREVQALLNLGGAVTCLWMAGETAPGSMRTFWLALVVMFVFLAFTPVQPRR